MKYPGRLIKKGESNKTIVKAIQKQLNTRGLGPIVEDGDFGNLTVSAVKLFQARTIDKQGVPLVADGVIGAVTWECLFGTTSVPQADVVKKKLNEKALEIALSQNGVREKGGPNCGPEVEAYLAAVGLGKGNAWCMAFVYWCFNKAATELSVKNPLVKTAGVLNGWNLATCTKVKAKDAEQNPAIIKPGYIFIMDYGHGKGHTGIVVSVEGGYINTIEGNTNSALSREGDGVFQQKRKIKSINKGFLVY